jgi:hypothetical protein
MALAPFFDKTALSAKTLLREYDRQGFEDKLTATKVALVFEIEPEKSAPQRAAMELAVNVLARLYPKLGLVSSDAESVSSLEESARRINPDIEFVNSLDDVAVVMATLQAPNLAQIGAEIPVIYFSSDGWVAKVGTNVTPSWGTSNNILGAAASACLAAANVFRWTFRDQLEDAQLDRDAVLNLADYSSSVSAQADLPPVDIGKTTLIGVGAIGSGVVWALGRTPGLSGSLTLVDHEAVELSNLQRYVITTMSSVNRLKVEVAEDVLASSGLITTNAAKRWSDFLDSSEWDLPRIAVAVDTVEERIRISGALAKEVLNSWTRGDEVGISRHVKYGEQACLACLYYPDTAIPNEDERILAELGLGPPHSQLVRDLLVTGKPVGRPFLEMIAQASAVPMDQLFRFEANTLRQFYSEAVCGGMMLRLGSVPSTQTKVEVPMAFQSALAGVLLAAEIILSASGQRVEALPAVTRLRTTRALAAGGLLTPLAPVAKCMCQDPDFLAVFAEKWA